MGALEPGRAALGHRVGRVIARRRGRRVAHAQVERRAGCAVLTVSDTRGPENDPGGDGVVERLARAGHSVVRRSWANDRIAVIRAAARRALDDPAVDVLVVTGGTGLAPRDVTPEALAPLIEREMPGFGERFRARSEAEVGSAAWLSRAGAGIARGRLVFWLPGSPAGTRLALDRLILPELGHALGLLGRGAPREARRERMR